MGWRDRPGRRGSSDRSLMGATGTSPVPPGSPCWLQFLPISRGVGHDHERRDSRVGTGEEERDWGGRDCRSADRQSALRQSLHRSPNKVVQIRNPTLFEGTTAETGTTAPPPTTSP